MPQNFEDAIWNYLVFVLVVFVTTVVPLWGRCFGKGSKSKVQTKADYVFATGAVSMFSMMISIARGTLGVRSFLGYPSELFYQGSGMWETIFGMITAYPIICFVFIPVYFNLKLTSVYQYIEIRFNSRLVRCIASGTYIFRSILNLGVTVFTPTVALHTILGVPIWASLVAITCISIIFNLLGGLKATVHADVIQIFITVVVSAVIIIHTFIKAGGVTEVYQKNRDSGRLNFFNFTGDLTVRVDTLSAWIGQLFISLSLFGCQQNFVQRYLSMDSIKQVRKMLMMNIPAMFFLFSLSWIVGMGIYSVYSECDPFKAGYIKSRDAILPFYVDDQYSFIPGLMGLFLSTLFNSALILNVSNLNSLATVTWEDFLIKLPQFKGMEDKKQLRVIKFIGSVYGLMILCVGFSVQLLTGVIETAQLMTSATSGPLLGIFVLAILVPCANWKGATAGAVLSHIIILTVTFGHLSLDRSKQFLYTSTEGCTNDTFNSEPLKNFNTSALMMLSMQETSEESSDYIQITEAAISDSDYSVFPQNVFAITYMYYSLFGTLITVVFGILVSMFTQSKADRYESKLIHPLALSAAKWFSGHENLFSDDAEKPLETYSSTFDQEGRKKSIEPNINLAFDKSGD